MPDGSDQQPYPTEASIAAFSERLADFAATMTERDRMALATLLARALDPIDRVRFYPPATTLNEREEAYVQALLDAQ